jgi:hypothetical protein
MPLEFFFFISSVSTRHPPQGPFDIKDHIHQSLRCLKLRGKPKDIIPADVKGVPISTVRVEFGVVQVLNTVPSGAG